MVNRTRRRLSSEFSPLVSLRLALSDIPGHKQERHLGPIGRPDILWRGGGTDLRTFIHVFVDRGYEFPFAVSDPRWIIDAGANVGYSALWFAEKYPNSEIVAIEPDPGNFSILQRNVRGYQRIHVLQAALWDTDGLVRLTDPGYGDWGFHVSSNGSGREVEAVSVESLIERFRIDRIGLLKIDIEGGEHAVFQSCGPWLDKVDTIAIELHDRLQPGCSTVFDRATNEFTHRAVRGEDTFISRS